MSIAFSIDPRARWQDGKPILASDVRYTFNVFTDPKVGSPVAPTLENLDSVTVRDSLTAVVWFKRRTPEQFYDVAYQLVIIPEHVYGAIPFEQLHTSELTRKPVGSGRFRLAKWDAGARIELIADTTNYRGRAKLDRVIFVPTAPATSAAQILSGQADFMGAFPVDQIPKLDSNDFVRPIAVPLLQYVYLSMNRFAPKSKTAPHPIFSELRVRRALSMSVDRESMLRNVFGRTGRLAHGPFPMTAVYADSNRHPPPYDTVAAKAMLDSSGWRVGANGFRTKNGRPLRFTLNVSPSLYRRRYSVLLQERFQDWRAGRNQQARPGSISRRARIGRLRRNAGRIRRRLRVRPGSSRAGPLPGSERLDRTCCATLIPRSMRCSTARRLRSTRR
jgi:peptide/nickel transport system substrate-binding protein